MALTLKALLFALLSATNCEVLWIEQELNHGLALRELQIQ